MTAETVETQSVVSVGSKIRSLRQRRTLDDTATASQLSKPFLLQVSEITPGRPSLRS
jgi:hypothetical protein